MLEKLHAYWILMTQVMAPARGNQRVNELARQRVLESLRKVGFFDYLAEPRTFGDLREEFNLHDYEYSTDVLLALTNDAAKILLFDGTRYQFNPEATWPSWEEIEAQTPRAMLQLPIITEFAPYIPQRMQGQSHKFAHRMETERESLMSFDETITNKIYDGLRRAANVWVGPYLDGVEGKRLLNIGCGSGRETAHLWAHFGGSVKIDAFDPVPSFIGMAEERFPKLIGEFSDGRPLPPITDANKPTFHVMDAYDLSAFEDATFDMIFYSQVFHWTLDPEKAYKEMFRVLKPGGVVWGAQAYEPITNDYMNLIIRVSDNVHGFFPLHDLERWYAENGAPMEELSGGVHRARKNGAAG